MGEANHPRIEQQTQRLRALQRSWDSGGDFSDDDAPRVQTRLSSDSDERPLVRPSPLPTDVIEAMEEDLNDSPILSVSLLCSPKISLI